MQREEAHLAGRSTALHDQTEAMLSRIHVQGHVGAAGLQAESGQLRSKLAAANDDKRELQAGPSEARAVKGRREESGRKRSRKNSKRIYTFLLGRFCLNLWPGTPPRMSPKSAP